MFSLGFDLAARYSAAALLDEDRSLLQTWVLDAGPAEKPARPRKHIDPLFTWVSQINEDLAERDIGWATNIYVTVEDLSHGMANPGPALRLQGALHAILLFKGYPEPTTVLPRVWLAHYGYEKTPGTTTKGWASWLCETLGYEFDSQGKSKVDERDAVLIARWRLDKELTPVS